MMSQRDFEAADFIIGLWGKKRRAFARRFWLFLAYGYDEPLFRDCLGASYIATELERIWYRGKKWKGE